MDTQSRLDLPLQKHMHPDAYFKEEREGWHGYIEWEKYPEKKEMAAKILSQYAFAGVSKWRRLFQGLRLICV